MVSLLVYLSVRQLWVELWPYKSQLFQRRDPISTWLFERLFSLSPPPILSLCVYVSSVCVCMQCVRACADFPSRLVDDSLHVRRSASDSRQWVFVAATPAAFFFFFSRSFLLLSYLFVIPPRTRTISKVVLILRFRFGAWPLKISCLFFSDLVFIVNSWSRSNRLHPRFDRKPFAFLVELFLGSVLYCFFLSPFFSIERVLSGADGRQKNRIRESLGESLVF